MNYLLLLTFFVALNLHSQSLPEFKFEDQNGQIIDQSSLTKEKPIILFYFSFEHDKSIDQLNKLVTKNTELKDVNVLLVCYDDEYKIPELKEQFLPDEHNMLLCFDPQFMIDFWFEYLEVGTIICYNRSWQKTSSIEVPIAIKDLNLGE